MNKEQIYDEQIFPLMAKTIEIAKEHKIAMLATFSIPSEPGDDLMCTTALLSEEYDPPKVLLDAVSIIRHEREATALTLRLTDGDGNVKAIETILAAGE